jgi:hypothetical protein
MYILEHCLFNVYACVHPRGGSRKLAHFLARLHPTLQTGVHTYRTPAADRPPLRSRTPRCAVHYCRDVSENGGPLLPSGLPHFLLGHSLGGLVSTLACVKQVRGGA